MCNRACGDYSETKEMAEKKGALLEAKQYRNCRGIRDRRKSRVEYKKRGKVERGARIL